MRCLPGCVASAVGGRAAAPPSRGRGVLLRRLTAAPLRRLRAGVVCCFGGWRPRRCAAFARAWCATSAAYGCALAGQKGRFPLDFHFVKVSPLSPAAPPPSLTFRRLHEVLAWVCCFGGWRPRRCAAFARAWCATSAAYGCALAGQKGRFPLDFHFVKVSPLSPAAPPPSLTFRRLHEVLAWVCCFGGWRPRRSKCFG
ncbi:hypothetical protein [Mobiluncus mulieris]|uniref:hypothetical protein n=1 Tax=Mobiluncus mulieris TaxID=2052 RepID=UPI00243238BF|nr:hypothetical protein [Mobiluncus mulieris]